jgi:hypothetical protein
MTRPKFPVRALFSLVIALGVNAQQTQLQDAPPAVPSIADKPVWALEFVKVKPGTFGPTMVYLDDNWIRVRAEAKRQGAVLTYNRIAGERPMLFPAKESSDDDWDILLMTNTRTRPPTMGAKNYSPPYSSASRTIPRGLSNDIKKKISFNP